MFSNFTWTPNRERAGKSKAETRWLRQNSATCCPLSKMVIMVEQTRQPLRQCVELLIIYVPIVAHHSTMVCMVANSKAHNSHQRNAFVQETAKQTHNTTGVIRCKRHNECKRDVFIEQTFDRNNELMEQTTMQQEP